MRNKCIPLDADLLCWIHILSKLTKDNFLWIGLIYTEGKLMGGKRFGKLFFRLHPLFPIFFRSHSLTYMTRSLLRHWTKGNYLAVFILWQGVYNIYSSALRIWGYFMPFSLLWFGVNFHHSDHSAILSFLCFGFKVPWQRSWYYTGPI